MVKHTQTIRRQIAGELSVCLTILRGWLLKIRITNLLSMDEPIAEVLFKKKCSVSFRKVTEKQMRQNSFLNITDL